MQKSGSGSERTPPAYPITSVDNALKLLLTFRDRPQLALSDASAYLGVAHSTAHRLLAMLAYHDFVRQERGLEPPACRLVEAIDGEQHGPVQLADTAEEVDGETLVVFDRVSGRGT